MINFSDFSAELFQIMRAYDREMVLYDGAGNRVYEPYDARRFYLTGDNILISIAEQGENSSLKVYLSPSLKLAQAMNFINTLRVLANKANLLFNVKKFNHDIKPQDFATTASVNENEEYSKMNIMEGMYGTSRSSYLKLENAKLIVRHGERVNENRIGARGRNIQSIFVENAQGERFLFPVNVLPAARAMTQHVNQGGTFADQVGAEIIRIASDFRNLAKLAGSNVVVAQPQAFVPVSESAVTAMKKIKSTFTRISESKYYERATTQLISTPVMEGEALAGRTEYLAAILGEGFSAEEMNTYARYIEETAQVLGEDTAQLDELNSIPGVEVEEFYHVNQGDRVLFKDHPYGDPFKVVDVMGDIVTVMDAELNTGKVSMSELVVVTKEDEEMATKLNLPISNDPAIKQFESWLDEFAPEAKAAEVDEATAASMRSGYVKDKNAKFGVNQVRGGQDHVILRDGTRLESEGPIKSPALVKGVIFMGSYSSTNQGADFYEVLGYSSGGDTAEWPSLKDAAIAYKVKTLRDLDAAIKAEKGDNAGVHMVVRDLEDDDTGGFFYVYNGKFCIGSGAETASFTKMRIATGESLEEAEDDIDYHELRTDLVHAKKKLAKMSPFDREYSKVRSQISDLEHKTRGYAPYGKSQSAVEETIDFDDFEDEAK